MSRDPAWFKWTKECHRESRSSEWMQLPSECSLRVCSQDHFLRLKISTQKQLKKCGFWSDFEWVFFFYWVVPHSICVKKDFSVFLCFFQLPLDFNGNIQRRFHVESALRISITWISNPRWKNSTSHTDFPLKLKGRGTELFFDADSTSNSESKTVVWIYPKNWPR